MGREGIFCVKLQGSKNEHEVSCSVKELECLIDDLNMSLVDIDPEMVKPFLEAVALLTEIKVNVRSTI